MCWPPILCLLGRHDWRVSDEGLPHIYCATCLKRDTV